MSLFQNIFSELLSSNVKFLVVGGVAVNAYGYRRFTGDLDIIVALDAENLLKLEKVMLDLGYTERVPAKVTDLGDQKKLKIFMEDKGMKAFTFLANQNLGLDLDIIVAESLDFTKYWNDRSEIKLWDFNLPVIGIDDLIAMKKGAGRVRDLEDLEALIKIKNL